MIQVVYSTEHWIVPRIVMGVLVVLLLAIIITEGLAKKKAQAAGTQAAAKGFFKSDADFKKLIGSFILFIGYVFCLEIIGFTVTSLVFVLLFNLLYAGLEKKAIIHSIIISVVASLLISIMFGVVFNITLPRGICTLELVQFGITLY